MYKSTIKYRQENIQSIISFALDELIHFVFLQYDIVLPLKEVIGRICVQIVGGLVGYSLMQMYWNLNLISIHVSRAYLTSSQGKCLTYLNVDNATGMYIG